MYKCGQFLVAQFPCDVCEIYNFFFSNPIIASDKFVCFIASFSNASNSKHTYFFVLLISNGKDSDATFANQSRTAKVIKTGRLHLVYVYVIDIIIDIQSI